MTLLWHTKDVGKNVQAALFHAMKVDGDKKTNDVKQYEICLLVTGMSEVGNY